MARQRRPGRDDPRYLAARKELKKYDHTCHVCGYAIDPQIKWPHPGSWSADHIIPTSRLTPDDPRQWHISNLQAAHMRCNSARGNTPLGLNTSQVW